MRTVKVIFEDGNTITTNINGTDEEIHRYYIGNYFNFGFVLKVVSPKLATPPILINFRQW